jgi:hypothetical protein
MSFVVLLLVVATLRWRVKEGVEKRYLEVGRGEKNEQKGR